MTEMDFKKWKEKVDQEMLQVANVISEDLPDQCYTNMFENGWSPTKTANWVLRQMEFFI